MDYEGHVQRCWSNFNQNLHLGYEDSTGSETPGLRRMEFEFGFDVLNSPIGRRHVMGVDDRGYSDKASKCLKETGEYLPNTSSGEMNYDQAVPGLVAHSGGFLSSCSGGYHPHGLGASDSSPPRKMKFLCSFGGRILPRPCDGKLRYVGGETRIITIRKNLSWHELMQKTLGVCNQQHTIKYQLPGEDLDALISISSDEDLQNMMEEYNELERIDGSQRLRIFLVTSNESDDCSYEARSLQGNSEYNYVVAVNGIVDLSPRKSSGEHSLASLPGHNIENVPGFHRETPRLHPLKIQDWTGMFSHPTSQFFIAAQNASKSPIHSPPFSPVPIQQKDSRNALKQLVEDNFYHGGNENYSVLLDQPRDYSYAMDPSYCPHEEIARHHPYKQTDADQPVKPHGLHFHSRTLSRDLACYDVDADQPVKPHGLHFHSRTLSRDLACYDDDTDRPVKPRGMHFHSRTLSRDLACYDDDGNSFCEKPFAKGRTSPSKKLQSQLEDSLSWLFGSTGSNSTHSWMPHTLSDLTLQEHGGRSDYCSQRTNPPFEFSAVASPSSMIQSIMQEGPVQHQEKRELTDSEFQIELPNTMSTSFQVGQDLKICSGRPEFPCRSESICNNANYMYEEHRAKEKASEPKCRSRDHHVESELGCEKLIQVVKMDALLHQDGKTHDTDIGRDPVTPPYRSKLPGIDSHPTSMLGVYVTPEESETSESKVPASSFITSETRPNILKEPSLGFQTDEIASEPPDPSKRTTKDDWHVSSEPLKDDPNMNNSQEHTIISSVNLSLFTENDDPKPRLNLHTHESLKEENAIFVNVEPKTNLEEQIQLESGVIVEDVTDNIPSGIHSDPEVVPYVMDVTDAESITNESESEDAKADDRERDESISDAAMAEMEAGIYGLQIIKNADLEELRELGSGTFGTVYHGKWRGTDVAIKRIKKSCFAGRSSEQERLTKDFWREAQILSKLHHPNVVAFYGVVPDGDGGTLATVTEFMVNGSLKNVLVRKEKALDRRKRLIIAMDAAFGMEYLHSKNIVHFDLKCENLLVNMRDSQRPICKVGDFGLSRIKRNTMVSGGVRGTLPWMAPELLNGSSSRVSEKVDVFSFGIAIWEILTGEEPYANMHCGAIIGGIVNNNLRPQIPKRCDPKWRKLMEDCWSPDPEARPSFSDITSRLRVMSMELLAKRQDPANI
ncbi:uncharacterized protein LOC131245697 [Magnolia sinica]|uniref:uncharacterized protein LOC131245697 n=1 Tax=Magnolia sinica TaxID=86752 RepID=UPI0026586819|nr:uncharacterized protein LOC131245697 [Magnolia sinica]